MKKKIEEVVTQKDTIITLFEDNVYDVAMEEKDDDE